MEIRISELDNEEVDHLRFDRIKIQRKRMEHILEVIKDLTFKNKELIRQNTLLKQEIQDEKHSKKTYEQFSSERKILMDQNFVLSNQLNKYRQTALQQQILISTLQEELQARNYRDAYSKDHYRTEPHLGKFYRSHNSSQENFIGTQQFQILKAQYDDLQKQYSRLYQSQYSKEKENLDMTGHIYFGKKNCMRAKAENMLKKACSSKTFENTIVHQESTDLSNLREKYKKLKKSKKELIKSINSLQTQMNTYKIRQENLVQLVQILKQTKTKICLCHVNKLEKQLQIKAAILDQHNRNNY